MFGSAPWAPRSIGLLKLVFTSFRKRPILIIILSVNRGIFILYLSNVSPASMVEPPPIPIKPILRELDSRINLRADAIVFVKDPERFANLEETLTSKMGFDKGMDLNRTFIKYISKAKRICTKPLICVMLKINEGFEEYKSRYNFKLKLLNRNVPVFENFDITGSVLNHMNTYREFLLN